MTVDEIQAFRASNGEIFSSEAAANARQQELDITAAVNQSGKPVIDAISSLIDLKGYTLGNYISYRLDSTSPEDLIIELQDKIDDLDSMVTGNP